MKIKNRYGILEHELELSWNIYGLALKAYSHADFLFFPANQKEKELVENSKSLRFLRVVCARTCVLEVTKLLDSGMNNHYNLWMLEERLRNKKFVGTVNISLQTLDEILDLLNQNRDEIKRVKTVRDKVVAHDDSNNHLIPRVILKDLLHLLSLIHIILCKLSNEQYQKICPPVPAEFKNIDIGNLLFRK